IVALGGLGNVYCVKGDYQKALSVLERGCEIMQQWDMPLLMHWTTPVLGYAYSFVGRFGDGLPLLEQSIAAARLALRARDLVWLAEAHLLAGRRREAADFAGRALAHARERDERGHEAMALRLLGEIAARADAPSVEEAEAHYRQARALAEELGMR